MSNQFNFSDGTKRELVCIYESGDVWVRHDIKPLDVAKIIKTMSERIKRLEEAGNNLLWNFCPEYTSDFTESQSDALKQWNKAKEVNP